MKPPPGQGDLFDLVPQVKPLVASGGTRPASTTAHRGHAEDPQPLPVEGRFVPPINYVSDTEEP